MFFKKSYTSKSVEDFVKFIRFMNDNIRILFEYNKPNNFEEISRFTKTTHLSFFSKEKREAAKIFQSFKNGFMKEVLFHFFDGENRDFSKFEKEAITSGFNYSSSMNFGKNELKLYRKEQLNDYYFSGEKWAKSYLIPQIIKKDIYTIEDFENIYEQDDEFEIENDLEEDIKDDVEEDTSSDNIVKNLIIEDTLNDQELDFGQKFKNSLIKEDKKRFKIYSDLYNQEINEYKILNKSNLKKFENYNTEGSDDTFIKNRKLYAEYYNYYSDSKLNLELFRTTINVFKLQNIQSKILFKIPTDKLVSNSNIYTKYASFIYEDHPFFKLADHISKNKTFSFKILNKKFPKYGRVLLLENIFLPIQISIEFLDETIIFQNSSCSILYPKHLDEDLISKSTLIEKKLFTQEVISLNNQIKNFKESRNVLTMTTEEKINFGHDGKMFSSYNEISEKILKKYSHEDIINDLTNMEFIAHLNDINFSFGYFLKFREKFYDENGSIFDDFDNFILNKLIENGCDINLNIISSNKGIIPKSLKFILNFERYMSNYFYSNDTLDTFKSLIFNFDDEKLFKFPDIKTNNDLDISEKKDEEVEKLIKKQNDQYLKNLNELKKFIKNFEFKIKNDEDYYEYDIKYDKNKKIANVKIEVILIETGPKKLYPFLDFKVDFRLHEFTVVNGISENTEIFTDMDDLKFLIEELIELQY